MSRFEKDVVEGVMEEIGGAGAERQYDGNIGGLISQWYEVFSSQLDDPEMVATLTADAVNRDLAGRSLDA